MLCLHSIALSAQNKLVETFFCANDGFSYDLVKELCMMKVMEIIQKRGKSVAKEDILTFLDQQIDQKVTDYDVALDWNTKNHTIEIIFRLYLASNEELAGEEEVEAIEFEDGILLYTEKSQFDANDYLYTMPFERKKGIESTTLVGLVTYLNEVLDQGMSDIFDFLEDEEAEVFELTFDEARLQEIIKNEGSARWIPYPKF